VLVLTFTLVAPCLPGHSDPSPVVFRSPSTPFLPPSHLREMRLGEVALGYQPAIEGPRTRSGTKEDPMQLSVEVNPASVRTESVQDGPPVPRFEEGRTCEQPGCRTVLSVYNDGYSCWAHRPMERVTSCTVQSRRRVARRSLESSRTIPTLA
jgi:hypothetical protein